MRERRERPDREKKQKKRMEETTHLRKRRRVQQECTAARIGGPPGEGGLARLAGEEYLGPNRAFLFLARKGREGLV